MDTDGDTIGRYKLLQRIGEGGFGVVYMAEQTEPVRRKVALKIIKLGMDTKQVIARFEAERQALAMMDHPHIAGVLDAGATETGRPYFVMELVRGIPITAYCARNRLAVDERLRLFIQVCHAVQHAHQKGIIHRDIKPSNVLVTLHDGVPVPRIIDFGIAKATSRRLTEETMFTDHGQFVGTPEYMSPEQAAMSGLDVDTRSDVYALGVLLYELLTGSTPFDGATLREAGYAEMQRVIRDEEPPRPSTRIGAATTARGAPTAARALRGDLDWITMHCLEKDRARRYGSAGGLAEDVARHLADEPVRAGPPSAGYRFSKFARRHRAAFAAGTTVAAALAVAVVAIVLALVSTRRSAGDLADALDASTRHLATSQRNEKIARDAVDTYYVTVSEERLLDEPGMADLRRELLDSAAVFYTRFVAEHADTPEVEGELARTLQRLAAISAATDARPEAMTLLETAEARYASLAETHPDDPDFALGLVRCRLERGELLADGGDQAGAAETVRATIDVLETLVTQHPGHADVAAELANARMQLGRIHYRTGDLAACATAWTVGLAAHGALVEQHPDNADYRESLALAQNAMGSLAYREGRLNEAADAYDAALALFTDLAAADPDAQTHRAALGRQHNNLAMLANRRGEWEIAAEQYDIAIRLRRALADDFPLFVTYRHQLANTYKNLAVLHLRRGEPTDALIAQQAAATLLERLVEEHPGLPEYAGDLGRIRQSMGVSYQRLGDTTRQRASIDRAVAVAERLLAEHPGDVDYRRDLAGYLNSSASASDYAGDPAAADRAYRRAVQVWEDLIVEVPNDTNYPFSFAQVLLNQGNLHRRGGAVQEALVHYGRAIDALETLREEVPDDREARRLLAKLYRSRAKSLERTGRFEASLADWDRCVETTPGSIAVLWSVWRGTTLVHLGRTAEALAHAEQVIAETDNARQIGYVLYGAAVVYGVAASRDTPEAEGHAVRAVELLERAADAGFFTLPGHTLDFSREPRFDALRDRDDFRALAARVEAGS